jgi:hypothetical protein
MADWRFRIGRVAALLLVVVACASSQAVAQTWIEFRPDGVGYSVEMPGKWVEQVQDVQSVMGPTKLHIATVDLGARAYITMYSSYPADAVRARSMVEILDGARQGALANVKEGKLRTEVDLTVNMHPGRQIIIDTPNLVLVLRYVLAGSTLVQAIVGGPRNMESEPVTMRFLESLKILKP